MKITNPTENDITIQYEGVHYTCPAKGSISIPEDVATYWKKQLHNFMILGESQVVAPVVEQKIEEKEVEVKSAKKTKK